MSGRICFLLKVRPERLSEYKERHKTVWPEMLEALRETGWRNYSIFLREDGLLIRLSGNARFPGRIARHGVARNQRAVATGDGALLRGTGWPPAG